MNSHTCPNDLLAEVTQQGRATRRWPEAVRWLVRIACLIILTAILWPGVQLWPTRFQPEIPQWIQTLESPEAVRFVPALSPWITLSSLLAAPVEASKESAAGLRQDAPKLPFSERAGRKIAAMYSMFSMAAGLGLAVGLLVIVCRRWFCRWMCPMGVCTELAGRTGRLCRLRSFRFFPLGQWIALLTLAGAAVGYPILLWMDPLALWAGWITSAALQPIPGDQPPNPTTPKQTQVAKQTELANQADPAKQADSAKQDSAVESVFRPAHPNWFAIGAATVLVVSFVLPGLWCGRLCPLGGFQEVLWQLRQMALGVVKRVVWIFRLGSSRVSAEGAEAVEGKRAVRVLGILQRSEGTASPFRGRGQLGLWPSRVSEEARLSPPRERPAEPKAKPGEGREGTASPLRGRGRPAGGWPGEGEKEAACSHSLPLTQILSPQGKGDKIESLSGQGRGETIESLSGQGKFFGTQESKETTESLPADEGKKMESLHSAELVQGLPPNPPEQPSLPGARQPAAIQVVPRQAAESGWKLGRRLVLAGLVGVVWAGWLRRLRSGPAKVLRPPGAAPEQVFTGLCIRCGNCLRACPSRILLPDSAQHGLAGFLAPVLHLDKDYCRENCNRCTLACPSGALQSISLAEKPKVRIGLAKVDMGRCMLGEARECFICRDRCPYQAIRTQFSPITYMVEVQIDPARCNGCGACQVACPTWPRAILVQPL
ncbi:MAG: 4Fe-4S dicluster domain-containing protein [Thermoguttaceae bacterium]|nr:4Fe-4S dicluster domain-containing protein [Thermoguttaceae bacterium]MDW8038152.1 4Fe-4S dicluster domain-containing protein [Thermoguttaceae bacterium]